MWVPIVFLSPQYIKKSFFDSPFLIAGLLTIALSFKLKNTLLIVVISMSAFLILTRMQLIRTLASSRPNLSGYKDITTACEIADLDVMMNAIVDELAPELVEQKAIGYVTASQLLITLGDNPERMKSEASFAVLCGVSPIPASSGKTNRHRLNRGGDRAALKDR